MNKKSPNTKTPPAIHIAMTSEFNHQVTLLFKKSGEEYFKDLAQFLCETTNTNFCFVGKLNSKSNTITTQSFYANGKIATNFDYDLKNTPCTHVIKGELCVYPNNVQSLFPKDKDLKTLGVESYIGLPLFDLTNNPVGLVAIMDTKALQHKKDCKDLLELIESKTALELERILVKETHTLSYKNLVSSFQNFQDVFFWSSYDQNKTLVERFVSPSIKTILGYSVKEYNQLKTSKLYYKEADKDTYINTVKAKRKVTNYPLTLIKKDGSLAHIEIDCEYINKGLDNNIAYLYRGVIKDVTAKVKEHLRIEIAYLIAQKSQRRLINLNLLGEYIHILLKKIINIPNLYIAVLEDDNKYLDFPYFKDEYAEADTLKISYNKKGFTECIINGSKVVVFNNKKENEAFHKEKSIISRGTVSENLIGIPLKSDGLSVGALVLQNYHKKTKFNAEDIELFKFIASQIAVIIARKLWQDKLIEKETYFNSLNENSSEIIGIINKNGIIEYISKAVFPLLKYQPHEVIGKNISDFIKIENLLDVVKKKVATRTKTTVEIFKIYDKNGNKKYLEASLSKNNISKKDKGIIFNVKDVTNRIISEKKSAAAQKRLHTLHAIEKALITNKSLGKVLTDALNAIADTIYDVDRLSIGRIDSDKKTLEIVALKTKYASHITINQNSKIPFQELSSIDSLLKKEPFSVSEIKKIKQRNSDKQNIEEGLQSYYISPIIINKKTIGTLYLGSKTKNYFDKIDTSLIKEITTLLAVVINDAILKEELDNRKKELTNIFNNSNEGIVRIGPDGNYLDANKKMLKLVGFSYKELSKLSFLDITHSGDLETSKQRVRDLKSEKLPEITYEKRFLHKNGKTISCKVISKAIFNKQKEFQYLLSFITDITALKKANQNINDLKNAIYHSANVLTTNTNGKITAVNDSVVKTSGYTRKELLGQTPQIFNSGYHPKAFFTKLWSTLLAGKIWQGEVRNIKPDGSIYWLFTTIAPIFEEDGRIIQFLAIRFDITKEKNAKTRLVKEVIEAQERERERFAMEIHDGLGQVLLAAKMNLNALGSSLGGLIQEDKDIFDTAVKLVTESIQEARNISHGLMSRVLNQFGLAYAINEIVNNINNTQNLRFIFQNNIENLRFDEEIEMGLYRTLQELIKNIIKHSKASIAYLKILKKGTTLSILVEDNGVGINKKIIVDSKEGGGIGLKNMKSRIEYLGGQFEIDENLKKGTRINIKIALKN